VSIFIVWASMLSITFLVFVGEHLWVWKGRVAVYFSGNVRRGNAVRCSSWLSSPNLAWKYHKFKNRLTQTFLTGKQRVQLCIKQHITLKAKATAPVLDESLKLSNIEDSG